MIEDGRITSYLYDHLTAERAVRHLDRQRPPGFRHLRWIPRMTNTYIAPATHTRGDDRRARPRGFYAVSFGGGRGVAPGRPAASSSASTRLT